jgi:hypothetical protein
LVVGNISFRDAFEDRQNQIFGHTGTGGVAGFHISEFDRWLTNEDEDEEDQQSK